MKNFFASFLALSLLTASGSLFIANTTYASSNEQHPVIVTDGANYTWEYAGTEYGNNVAFNNIDSWVTKAVASGIAYLVIKKIPNDFFKGVAGYVSGSAIKSIPSGEDTWWTVKKYVDEDAYHVYIKYKVWVYSDSSRSNLISYYTQIHRY